MCIRDRNYIVPSEIGMLFDHIYHRRFVNPMVSEEVEDILLLQQINHKIPGRIGEDTVPIAHKTGEDENLSNDVGLSLIHIYARPIRAKKREDLQRRKELMEGETVTLGISIHLNSFPQDASVYLSLIHI